MKIRSIQKLTAAEISAGAIQPPSFINNPGSSLNCFARVVLHRIDKSSNYEGFHEVMEDIGFRRFIDGFSRYTQSRICHKLPDGMYYFDAGLYPGKFRDYTLEKVYNVIWAAVIETVKDAKTYTQDANTPPSVLIIPTNRVAWDGLEDAPMEAV